MSTSETGGPEQQSSTQNLKTPRPVPVSGFWGPCSASAGEFQVHYTYDRDGRLVQIRDKAGEGIAFTYHPAGFVTTIAPIGSPGEPILALKGTPWDTGAFKQHFVEANAEPEVALKALENVRAMTKRVCPAEQTLLVLYPFFSSGSTYLAGRNYALEALTYNMRAVDDVVYASDSVYKGLKRLGIGETGLELGYADSGMVESYAYNRDGCPESMSRAHHSGKYRDTGRIHYDDKGRAVRFTTSGYFMVPGTSTDLTYDPQGRLATIASSKPVTFEYLCQDNTTNVAPGDR